MPNTKYKIFQPKTGLFLDENTKNTFLFILFVAAFTERVFFDFGPNFELVTTAVILSSFYVGRKQSFWTIFLIMLFSDIIIGNTNIFIFTWSGFLIPALFSRNLINKLTYFLSRITNHKSSITKKIVFNFSLTSTGLIANFFFYIWTNLGVWLLSGMYPKNISGLLMSYINALPFLHYQFLSNLIFIPVGFLLTELTISVYRKYLSNNKYIKLLNKN